MKLTKKDNLSLFYMFTLFIALILAIFFCIPQNFKKESTPKPEETHASSGFTTVLNWTTNSYTFYSNAIYRATGNMDIDHPTHIDSGTAILYIPTNVTV